MTLADAAAAYRHDLAVVRRMTSADAPWAAALQAVALGAGRFYHRLGCYSRRL